jgi:hypothetical protein
VIPQCFMFPSWLGTKECYSPIRVSICCRTAGKQDPGSSEAAPKSQVSAVQGTNLEQREPQAWSGKCKDRKPEVRL